MAHHKRFTVDPEHNNVIWIQPTPYKLNGLHELVGSGSVAPFSGRSRRKAPARHWLVAAIAIFLTALLFGLTPASAKAATGHLVRLKDISDIEGVRSNMLIGYGLIVGLSGSGDSVSSIPFTRQSLINMLERLGVNSKEAEESVKTKNVAAVMITAELHAFARQGSRIDVAVSSLGDAKSLEGGYLLATPLMGADGNTYAVAQGALVLGGFSAEGAAGTVSKNHTTAGRIASGAIVERETGFELSSLDRVRIILRNPDFNTATRVRDTINTAFGEDLSKATDQGTIDIAIPARYREELVAMINKVENLRVRPDAEARVVVDEKTGTIVMGEDVRISNVAISHANLTIRISELQQVSQPGALAQVGETQTTDRTNIEVDEGNGKFRILETGVSLADLVNGLNSLGVKPRDIISILQNIKAVGALQAEIKLM